MTATASRTRKPKRVAAVSAGPHFAAFAEAYCVHTKGRFAGKPFVLEPWQHEFVNELFLLDENGRRVYQSVVLGIPRKNGKSALASALALYLGSPADAEASPEIILAAGTREQAGMVFDQARAFVDHPQSVLGDFFVSQARSITCPENSGVIKRVAADGKKQHGLNPSAAVKDELWAWETPRQVELDEALETAMGARDEPLSLAITTAGYDKFTILGKLYDKAVNLDDVERRPGMIIARDRANGFLFWWYGASEDDNFEDPSVWAQCNPASWITEAFLRRQLNKPTMDVDTFRRFHLNQWTKSRAAWLPSGTWSGLKVDQEIADGSQVHVGVDASISHDSTAVSWAWKNDEGRVLTKARVWSADETVPHHVFVPGGKIDLRDVRDFIIDDLAERFTIKEVVYDPRFFDTIANDLSDAGLTVAPVHQNSAAMADAYQAFYMGCREGRLAHDGDPVLAAHVEATAAVKRENGWKVSKLRSTARIDACVSTAIAFWRAAITERKRRWFYDPNATTTDEEDG